MPQHRYSQFCPTARAVEILGERWTLLIARELLCGPQRFSDLRRRLPGISSSVLSERLARLEERGLVARREAPVPAPATLYALTPLGGELREVLVALMRFGVRFIEPPRPGDHLEPDWMRLALLAFARREPTRERCFAVRIPDAPADVEVLVRGGPRGTEVRDAGSADPAERAAPDAALRADPLTLLALLGGRLDPDAAIAAGRLEVSGDAAALRDFPRLFDLDSLLARPDSTPTG